MEHATEYHIGTALTQNKNFLMISVQAALSLKGAVKPLAERLAGEKAAVVFHHHLSGFGKGKLIKLQQGLVAFPA